MSQIDIASLPRPGHPLWAAVAERDRLREAVHLAMLHFGMVGKPDEQEHFDRIMKLR